MPIDVRCAGCGGKFQASDKLAGKRVKCPRCSGTIVVGARVAGSPAERTAAAETSVPPPPPPGPPGSDETRWYVLTTDDEQLGPIGKADVETLVAQGRLDAFCRLRQEKWNEWRWIEDVFPGLASPEASESGDDRTESGTCADVPLGESEARLQPCPDCGQMVSRRARHCPHCGCPVAEVAPEEAAASGRPPLGMGVTLAGVPSASGVGRRTGRRNKIVLLAAGSAALVVVGAAVGVWWVWSVLSSPQKAAESLLKELTIEEPLPENTAPPSQAADSQSYEAWAKEASAAMAGEIDELYEKTHLANSLLSQAEKKVDLLKSLAEPNPAPDAPNKPSPAAPAVPDAYESQYDPLYAECLQYVRKNVAADGANRDAVWDAARRWADAKRAPVEKQLEKQLQQQLGL